MDKTIIPAIDRGIENLEPVLHPRYKYTNAQTQAGEDES